MPTKRAFAVVMQMDQYHDSARQLAFGKRLIHNLSHITDKETTHIMTHKLANKSAQQVQLLSLT